MRKFLLKRLLPYLASQVNVDIDTISENGSRWLRVRVEVFDFSVLDEKVKVSDQVGHDEFVISERLNNH